MILWLLVAVLWLAALCARFYALTHDLNWSPRARPYYPLWIARALLLIAAGVTGAVLS